MTDTMTPSTLAGKRFRYRSPSPGTKQTRFGCDADGQVWAENEHGQFKPAQFWNWAELVRAIQRQILVEAEVE